MINFQKTAATHGIKNTQLEIVKVAFGHSMMATHPPLSQNFVVEAEGVSCVFLFHFLIEQGSRSQHDHAIIEQPNANFTIYDFELRVFIPWVASVTREPPATWL